jgi:hypothetical protein
VLGSQACATTVSCCELLKTEKWLDSPLPHRQVHISEKES